MVDFASTLISIGTNGNRKVTRGTWTNSATGAKDINTRLKVCTNIKLRQTGAAVVNDAPSVNETLPADGSAITIVTTGDTQDGTWEAEGY